MFGRPIRPRAFFLALLGGLILAAGVLAQRRPRRPGAAHRRRYRDPFLFPWVYNVDPSGNLWAGVDHPYYQPRLPFRNRRISRHRGRRGRYENWMVEGEEALRRGETKVARHRFEEARDLASEAWGDRSRQALRAAARLHALRPSEGVAESPVPELAVPVARSPLPPAALRGLETVPSDTPAVSPETSREPVPDLDLAGSSEAAVVAAQPGVSGTLARIRAKLAEAAAIRQRSRRTRLLRPE